ncbi:hypothetical protein CTI14_27345, partial [Methylobacterium radiotolerans]
MGAITVPHPSTLIQSHAGHPTLMLHEFAHAFEDLKLNFASPAIQAAYDRAHAARLYRDDLTSDHYADRNPREYFASLTEIYFGLTKDKAPPNTPAALKALDPDGYAAIAAAWSVNPKAPYFASLTEIYFGLTKDKAPPNTPAALKALDPDG